MFKGPVCIFGLIYDCVLVKAYHNAHKYITKCVYMQYNESNLVSHPSKGFSMSTRTHTEQGSGASS